MARNSRESNPGNLGAKSPAPFLLLVCAFSPGPQEPSQAGAVPRQVHWTNIKQDFELLNLLPGHTTHWPLAS
jgi:hypothetical protein